MFPKLHSIISCFILSTNPITENFSESGKKGFVDSKIYSYKFQTKFFFTDWCLNPFVILIFMGSLIINTVLYPLYLFFFTSFTPYWLFKFIVYFKTPHLKEVTTKPTNELVLWGWSTHYFILHVIYLQTIYKGYVNSLRVVYTLFKIIHRKIVTSEIHYNTNITYYVYILLRILTSILFKILTSIPKNIVLESYKWSKNFTYVYKRWHIYKFDLGNNLRRLIINSLIKKTIYNNLFPQSFLRVYRTRESGWNFNPHKLFTTKLDLAYSNKNVRQIVLRCIENDLYGMSDWLTSAHKLNVAIDIRGKFTTPPHICI